MHEFVKFITGVPPYDLGYGGEHFNVMAWWRGVKSASNAEFAMLAEVLFSVAPHCASVERLSSDFGWFQSRRRSRLDPDAIGKLAAIRRALRNEERGAGKRRAPGAPVSEESEDEDGDNQETCPDVEELVAQLEALAQRLAPLSEESAELAAEAPPSRGEEPTSFMELLMGNWDGFDTQAELHPGFVPGACVAEVPGLPLGPVQDFDAEALAVEALATF